MASEDKKTEEKELDAVELDGDEGGEEPDIKGHLITIGITVSPNQWLAIEKKRREMGRGTGRSAVVRAAIAAYLPDAQDEVAPQGSYDRTARRRRKNDDDSGD